MKKIFISFLILSCFSFASAMDIKTNVNLEGFYSSNILSLSDKDYQRYLDGKIGSYYDIESADDFVTNLSVSLKNRNKLFGHLSLVNLKFDYDLYAVNKVFDKFNFTIDTKYYFNRNFDVILGYSWSPEIYVNNYTSVWDNERHQYTYSKNDYFSTVNWDLSEIFSIRYKIKFSQHFYNKYFTEYDSDVFENGISLIGDFQKFKLTLGYAYKLSEAAAEEAFEGINYSGVIKDGSYDSNKYKFALTIPSIFSIAEKDVKFHTSVIWEERFFSSDFVDDEYHYGREAERLSAQAYLRYNLTNSTSIKILGKFQNRNTDSVYHIVAEEKTYDAYQLGLRLDIKLK
jgi:hypothetical protein